jgi:radical SAM superfamily enzyme YgiQ (UPF0313 family)
MKICFLVCVDEETEKTQMFGVRYMPVWVYTLAAHLRDDPTLELLLHDTRLKGITGIPSAEVYFYSALNQDVPSNVRLMRRLRESFPSARHAIGGPATGSLKMAGRLSEVGGFDGVFVGEGEGEVRGFIARLLAWQGPGPLVHAQDGRFPLGAARPMDYALLAATAQDYYGGVVEVSRGCPFLCEFCDIRTLPDNNRAHNKPVETVIADLEQFHRAGVTNVLFACDNFIGDPAWAEAVCDAVVELKVRTGYRPQLYTWLTINVANHPRLIGKMRAAGFDMFFIGLESFGTTQLMETAKIQNTKFDLPEAVRRIQSHGVVVVAGLIFGFDSDGDDAVDVALEGIIDSGLISGDPTLLTALAGTPLYRRIELAGRLREGKVALGGHKYSTNIRYLRPKDRIIADYTRFVHTFNAPAFQLRRYQRFLACRDGTMADLGEKGGGYIRPASLLRLITRNRAALGAAAKRLWRFGVSPARLGAVMRAAWWTLRKPGASWAHFAFWVFNWSNSIMKYGGISPADFDIESVEGPIRRDHILPPGYLEDRFEPIPEAKIKAQRQMTVRTLEKILP